MALQLADRVQVTATANTTVSFSLGSAVTGYQNFSVITNGNTVYYGSSDGTNWEVGIGTYNSTGPVLTRTTILSSSNSGSAVSTFGASVNVWIDYPSEYSVNSGVIGGLTSGYVPYGSGTPTLSSVSTFRYTASGLSLTGYAPNTTTTVGWLNVGDNTYNYSSTGQIATFAGSDSYYTSVVLLNTNTTSASAYSALTTAANNYSNVYMEIGTNSSAYSYTGAGAPNNNVNMPNANFVESVGSDLSIVTYNSNAIHFIVNSSTASVDALTISAAGAVTTPNLLTGAEVAASNGIFVNNKTVSVSYSIPSGYSASSAGPMTLASGVAVTVPSGSRWVVL